MKINNINKTIILIDGTLYLYKSYYRYNNIYNNNELSNVIYGILYLLNKIIFYNPSYISFIFDFPCKNFRKIIYEEYKKNRKPCPEELYKQIPKINEILYNIGIPIISIPNVESDDIIGTISKQAERNNFKIIIISSDKDMSQLVSNNIKILDIFSNNKIIGPKDIYNKYKIYPKSIIDYFSLVGDFSDNIPGIKGIGPKTANILINKFKDIKNLYLKINDIYNIKLKNLKNIINNLLKNKDKLFLYYDLIKIRTNIFTGYKIEKLNIKNKINIKYLRFINKKYNIFYK